MRLNRIRQRKLRRRIWAGIIVVGFIGCFSFFLGGPSNSELIPSITQSDVFHRWVDKVLPLDIPIPYGNKIIANKEVYVEGRYSEGKAVFLPSPDARIKVSFVGTKVEWGGYTSDRYGLADVYLDSRLISSVDLYSPTIEYKKALFISEELPYGEHELDIRSLGKSDLGAKGTAINLDYVKVWNGEQIELFEENHHAIQYINANNYYYNQFLVRKIFHAMLYAGIALSILIIFKKMFQITYAVAYTILASVLIAIMDEVRQSFTYTREGSLLDVGVDFIGILATVTVYGIRCAWKRKHQDKNTRSRQEATP
jgi:VanZ family protein